MKKAWKWAMIGLGLPIVSLAGLWIDSYYRSVAAIRAEDERLAKDIAAFRTRWRPTLAVDTAYLRGSAVAPHSFHHQTNPWRLEEGHSDPKGFKFALYQDRDGRSTVSPSLKAPDSVLPGDAEISILALTYRTIRECGFELKMEGYKFEEAALGSLQRLFDAGLPAADLRRIAGLLDRALASRPSFADVLEAEYLRSRVDVLQVLHRGADPLGVLCRPPRWKESFSWRILIVKCLRQLDDDAAILREDPRRAKFEPTIPLTNNALRAETSIWEWYDRLSLARLTLARVATAVALFRAERGRDLARIEELVPEYLPKIPINPVDGHALAYSNGVVYAKVGPLDSIKWRLPK